MSFKDLRFTSGAVIKVRGIKKGASEGQSLSLIQRRLKGELSKNQVKIKQGHIHSPSVADGWAGAENLENKKCDRPSFFLEF